MSVFHDWLVVIHITLNLQMTLLLGKISWTGDSWWRKFHISDWIDCLTELSRPSDSVMLEVQLLSRMHVLFNRWNNFLWLDQLLTVNSSWHKLKFEPTDTDNKALCRRLARLTFTAVLVKKMPSNDKWSLTLKHWILGDRERQISCCSKCGHKAF